MKLGISTACLYPMAPEEALEHLISGGFRFFEIFLNTISEIRPDFVKEIKRRIDACGGEVGSIHPFTSGFETMLLFSDYRRRFLDGLEIHRYYFDAANLLGASIFVLHGERDYRRCRITEEEYLERYVKLYELGKSYGITVAQENVNLFRSEDPSFIRRMRKSLGDSCAFVLDLKQAVRAGFEPFEMCTAMGQSLVHIHLNDHDAQHDCILPGRGETDYGRFRKLLESLNYQGNAVIEVYRRDFQEEKELGESYTYLQKFLGKNSQMEKLAQSKNFMV